MSGMFPYFFKAAVLGLQELYPKGHSGTVFLYDCWTVRLVIFPFGSVGDAVLGDSNRVNRNAFHTTHGACVAGLSLRTTTMPLNVSISHTVPERLIQS